METSKLESAGKARGASGPTATGNEVAEVVENTEHRDLPSLYKAFARALRNSDTITAKKTEGPSERWT